MSNYLGLFQFGLLASFGFAVLTALASLAVYPLVRQRLFALPPARRSNILLTWLLAPAFVGLLFTLLSFMPSLFSIFGIVADHCDVHDTHLHLCLIHPPLPADSMISWLLVTILAAMAVILAGTYTLGLVRARRFYKALMMASHQHDGDDIRVVDWNIPLAISAGVYRMRVFISAQLMQILTSQQLEVVLAHEQAHSHRKDALRHLVGQALSFAHIPWLRRRLLADMDLACEQACDEAAASRTCDRLHVADTIVSIERLFGKQELPVTVLSISGSNISQRVESLLLEPAVYVPTNRAYIVLIGITLLIASFAFVDELHHQTESILGFLIR
jgi:Zn-dependent protease with chaperone function